MFGRLLRKSKLQPNKVKRYFKVAPKNEIGYIEHVMWGMLQLLTKKYYSVYNNNPSDLPLPVIAVPLGLILETLIQYVLKSFFIHRSICHYMGFKFKQSQAIPPQFTFFIH